MIRINLFGHLRLTGADGRVVPVTGAKTQGLVAYLALNTGMPPSRDRLMTLFWGDRFTEQARQSLRQAISKLRKTFEEAGEDVVVAEADRVGLDPEAVSVDVDLFARLAADPSPAAAIEASRLMEATLLEGIYGQESEFEDWIASERQRVATLGCRVCERAAEDLLRVGKVGEALETARRLVAIDPLRDASQMLLIRILAQSGERAQAIQRFRTYEADLGRELGVEPGADLRRLVEEIRSESFLVPPAEPPKGSAPEEAASTAEDSRTRIAVVPFTAMTPGPEDKLFVDAFTEDLTTNLARFRWLDVRAGPAAAPQRLNAETLAEIGKAQGLDVVVHGTLRSFGRDLRLTVHIGETRTGRLVWVTRYDRSFETAIGVLDELSDTVAASIEAELERIAGKASRLRPFEEMSAWDCYHRGLAIQYEFSAATNAEAQRHFRRAIELDPNFAAAYARCAYALVISAIYFEAGNVAALLDEALDLARAACRLDPGDAVGRFALGRVYLARGEYERSLAELETAVALNPSMAQAHCALGDSLAYAGSLDQAMPCFDEAVRLSPSDPYRWAFLGYGATALLFRGDFQAAADWAQRAEAVPNSHYWATAVKAAALGHLGDRERAARAVEELRALRPGITSAFVRERLFYLRDPAQLDIYVEGLRKAGLD